MTRFPRLFGFVASTLVVFAMMAAVKNHLRLADSTRPTYSAYQAWSFLNGRTNLDLPAASHDLSPYEGKVYAYFGPLPALLMAPVVRRTGPGAFPQRWFAIWLAALCGGLYFLIFHRLGRALDGGLPVMGAAALVAGFALGSSNIVFALVATQWVVVQLSASLMVLIGLAAILERSRWRTLMTAIGGVAFGLSVLGRANLLFTLPVWLYLALSDEKFGIPREAKSTAAGFLTWLFRREAMVRCALVLLPLGIALAAQMWFNFARFGDPLEFGLAYHNASSRFHRQMAEEGVFNLLNFPRNAYVTLLRPPFAGPWDHIDLIEGFSLFFQMPLLLLAFLPLKSGYRDGGLRWTLLALLVPGAVFILCCMGTGWFQWGARYLYDLVPFMAIALFATRQWKNPAVWGLVAAGIAINVWGAKWLIPH